MSGTWAVLRPSGTVYSLHHSHAEATWAAADAKRVQGWPVSVVLWR